MFASALEKASAGLKGLRANRARLEGKEIALESELATLRAVTSDQLLDSILAEDGGHSDAAMRVATIEAQLADLEQAKAALIRRMQTAIVDVGKARAEELRSKAKKLQGKLDRLSAERLKLLEQLGELQGSVNFAKEYFTRSGFLPLGMGGGLGPVAAPTFDKLESEISQLHADAAAIERRTELSAAGGRVSAGSLDELLAICEEQEQLAPLHREIRAWFEAASAAAASAWRVSPLGAPMNGEPDPLDPMTNFTLAWKDGAIDPAESGWRNLQNRRPTHFDHIYSPRDTYAQASAAVTARGY